MVFVPCLSQDMDPISDMSYSNQAVPVESRILDVPERTVTISTVQFRTIDTSSLATGT